MCWIQRLHRSFSNTRRRLFHFSVRNLQPQQTSIDCSDIEIFAELSPEWAKENGSFKALYSMNRLRIPLVVDVVGHKAKQNEGSLSGLHIADIGCGGGILTFPLARLGANVSAIDASKDVIDSVREAESCFRLESHGPGKVVFHCSSVEDFAAGNAETFDAVVASEIIEHVADVELFVQSCARLVRKDGALLFTTINKTVASRVLAVWMAEAILGIVPRGVHDWSKFIDPRILRIILEEYGCSVRLIHGMIYNPLTNRWSWSRNTAANYALVAIKS